MSSHIGNANNFQHMTSNNHRSTSCWKLGRKYKKSHSLSFCQTFWPMFHESYKPVKSGRYHGIHTVTLLSFSHPLSVMYVMLPPTFSSLTRRSPLNFIQPFSSSLLRVDIAPQSVSTKPQTWPPRSSLPKHRQFSQSPAKAPVKAPEKAPEKAPAKGPQLRPSAAWPPAPRRSRPDRK